MPETSAIIGSLSEICGPGHVATDESATAPYLTDWRKTYTGKAMAVVSPGSTGEVARVIALANRHRLPVVPQGGNTSLCGGATPDSSGQSVLLSLNRMDRIIGIDPGNNAIAVEAGCILETVQKAAADQGLLFPLDLGARGSCRIGGNLSTNAGGLNMLKYGNSRTLCLGLEAVLPDGRVMDLMTPNKKDNTGYDLKNLFIGAEGTLGVITAATLQLFPVPKAVSTAFAGVRGIDAAITLLHRCQAASGGRVTAFELISRALVDNVREHYPDTPAPLSGIPDFCVLADFSSTADADAEPGADGGMPLDALMERTLEEARRDGLIHDATIARSERQRAALWSVRERIPESETLAGESYKSDISVPLAHMAEFYRRGADEAEAIAPGVRVFGFGHLGDGNLHYNLCVPRGGHPDFASLFPKFDGMLMSLLGEYGGSVSAEHGIGQMRRSMLKESKDEAALSVMAAVKQALDPNGIMNPGKILP